MFQEHHVAPDLKALRKTPEISGALALEPGKSSRNHGQDWPFGATKAVKRAGDTERERERERHYYK